MKRCLKCDYLFDREGWGCPECHWAPVILDNVPLFAERISCADKSYDPSWYQELVRLEEKNFWFVGRNSLIKWFAERYISPTARYLELGCGSGFVLKMLSQSFPKWKISATEVQLEGLKFARNRVGTNVHLCQVDGQAIPFRDEFDVVGAFDVIEHIEADELVLREIYFSLKENGLFLFSVPQHMFLWSQFDDIGCHFRRYEMKDIKRKLDRAGFRILDTTSFNSLLLPLMLISRWGKRSHDKDVDVMQELRLPQIVNTLLAWVLKVEFCLIRMGIRWPVGGSRLVIAQKILK